MTFPTGPDPRQSVGEVDRSVTPGVDTNGGYSVKGLTHIGGLVK